ncbi:MAG: hypothetical protein K2Y22_06200 [Candidatus Obscuribacterales bacterium]|nr:hypothetical protein [Candidatus Obscuribacterales bacterium]
MTNQDQPQPASEAAKQLIQLWNSACNSFFLTVETEDGPNPPEIVVNVRSSEESYVRAAERDIRVLSRIMETAGVQTIPVEQDAAGKWVPTAEGQKTIDESGERTDLTGALLMTLAMVFIDTKALNEVSVEDLLAVLQAMSSEGEESEAEEPTYSLQIRSKNISKEAGKEITHITINVLSDTDEEEKKLKALQEEFVRLYKSGKITVRLKPYTDEEKSRFTM